MNRVVYAACDEKYYYDHAKHMAESAARFGEKVYIDVIDPVNKIQSSNENIIVSNCIVNPPPNADKRTLYACFRFLRAKDLLDTFDEMLIVDADGLFRSNVNWDYFKDADLSLFFRDPLPNTNEWETEGSRIAAGAVYTKKTALAYWEEVHDLIMSIGFRWFVDQYSLYATYRRFDEKGAIKCIQMPKTYIDWEMNDDSVIWTGKGNRKYTNETYLKEKVQYENV